MKRTTPTVTTTALSVVAAATMAWGLTACGNNTTEPTNTAATSASTTSASATMTADTTTAPPDRAPEELTQREKAARLMMVGVKNYDDARTALKNGAGGIFIGSWTDPALLTSQDRNIAALRAEIGRPFAVSIDAEGGRVQRQPALFGSVPSPREMAATMKPEQVTGVARDLGTKLRERGITMDFAPVLDVDGGSANGAIGDRSFSGDPVVAATYATAFAQGLREAGIEPVYKHFPGHGRASGDTHKQTSRTPALASLKEVDLPPFGKALSQVPAPVMLGHLVVPEWGDLPTTLNPAAYNLLRSGDYPEGSPYDGVIVTDDLSGMKAISDRFSTPTAALTALTAGADIALWITADDLPKAIDEVDAAVTDGRYPREKFEASFARATSLQPDK